MRRGALRGRRCLIVWGCCVVSTLSGSRALSRLFIRSGLAAALLFVLGLLGEFFLTLLKCIVWRDQLAFLSEGGEIGSELTVDELTIVRG
jgi:hypothetical protein